MSLALMVVKVTVAAQLVYFPVLSWADGRQLAVPLARYKPLRPRQPEKRRWL